MGWLERWEFDSTPPLSQSGVSPRLLRHLVGAFGLRFGARALVVAAEDEAFARVFSDLGIDTVAVSPADSIAGGDDGGPFDLVLVHADNPSFANLRDPSTVQAATEWKAAVKPGGAIVLLAEREADGRPAGHALSCYRSLLARFPGNVECEEIAAGTLWQRLRGDVTDPGWFATAWRAPREASDRGTLALPEIFAGEAASERACCTRAARWTASRSRAAA